MDIFQVVQSKPQLLPMFYEKYKHIVEFKATFHNIHMCMKGYVEGVWYELPYMVTKDDLTCVTIEWPTSWLEVYTTNGASSSVPLKTPTKLHT